VTLHATFEDVFGLSFGEFCVLIIVAIVVIGPKDLPRVLRKLGQWAGKARRLVADVRAQSGIDDVLQSEGLTKELSEIRRLAQGDFRDLPPPPPARAEPLGDVPIVREREYPREGPDSYGALPDSAVVYGDTLPTSPLARDPLYVTGDATAKLPSRPDDPGVPAPPATPGPDTGHA
jgi:sec-independent protein translocase protein TatB